MPYIEYIGTTNVRRKALDFFMYGSCDKERIPCQLCKQSFFFSQTNWDLFYPSVNYTTFALLFFWEKMVKFFILKTLREKIFPCM
jgi:hypothetical protein